MGKLVAVVKSLFEKRTTAPGKAVVVQTTTAGNIARTTELYHPPGISSAPTEGDKIVEIPLGSGVRVAVATHNYKLEVSVTAGETVIYSTNSKGDEIKAQIKLDTEGNIDLNGDSKNLVTHAELKSALDNYVTMLNLALTKTPIAGNGAPQEEWTNLPSSIDISSSKTEKVRTG